MKKTLLELYALAVCFFAVACFAVALGIGIYAAVGIAQPGVTINSYAYLRHQTNDAFWESESGRYAEKDQKPRPAEAELTRQREKSMAREWASERRDSTQTALKCAIILLIDLVIFLFHWGIARRARSAA